MREEERKRERECVGPKQKQNGITNTSAQAREQQQQQWYTISTIATTTRTTTKHEKDDERSVTRLISDEIYE